MNFENEIVAVYFQLIKIAETYYYHDERAYDLAAETVRRALEARDLYDDRYPLLTWCRAIMRNLWKNTEQKLSNVSTQRLGDWDVPGGEEADQRVIVNDVLSVIQKLQTRSVAVPALVDFAEGYSMAEIAAARGVPLGTVKRRIHDARKMVARLVNVN